MVRTRARVAAESARAAAVRARAATAAVLESPDLLAVVIKQIAAQEHGWAAALWRVGAVSTLWRTVVHSVRFDLEEWTEWRWTIPDARKKLFKPPATVAEEPEGVPVRKDAADAAAAPLAPPTVDVSELKLKRLSLSGECASV